MRITARNLVKKFGKFSALYDLNFDVDGDIIAIVGPNGSGKSTLLSIVAGLRHPSRGNLYLEGIEPYKRREDISKYISYSFEKPRFDLKIRVRDVLEACRETCKDYDHIVSMMDEVGIKNLEDKSLYQLSSGQSQLLALSLALYCDETYIVILDEPLSHLDIRFQHLLIDRIYQRKRTVFTTHVMEEAELIADKILILEDGKLKWIGDSRDVYQYSIYEVIIPRQNYQKAVEMLNSSGAEIITNLGTSTLVKNVKEEYLVKLFDERLIIGFRRAGLRVKIYG
ncbi:hypothetical protein SUSAZ_08860 [Sulfolobus acidocaldarius SUSAZ]|nr:hypothetical protein SUSAZ_08860 [Sulfolobus acidocaldarius SUSAZ]